ncbi:MAG: DMT family transporter [Gammaproteobacteria bacterium]
MLGFTRQTWPSRPQFYSLLIVVAGVVIGFPLLTAWAMHYVPAAHGAIVLGILPLATTVVSTLRGGERPSAGFWAASVFGSVAVLVYILVTGAGALYVGDLALLGAIVAAAYGYAEGGRLAKLLGGWQVISWALVIAGPILVIPVALSLSPKDFSAPAISWWNFAYVTLISQFLGFFAWYHGLALAGVARVSQLQLLQPFLTLIGSALLLGERVTALSITFALIIVGSVAVSKKMTVIRT